MPSENYLYYCLDSEGHLHDAAWFHAATDKEAVEQIRTKHPDSKFEIWQDNRLVAALSPMLRSV